MKVWQSVWDLLVLFIAAAGVIFAYLVAFSPELLPSAVRTGIQQFLQLTEGKPVLLIIALVLTIGGLLAIWGWRERTETGTLNESNLWESNRNVPVAGGATINETRLSSGRSAQNSDSVATTLRNVLIAAYEPNFDDVAATEAFIDRGEWTEDQYAAAFLSTTDSLDYPFLHRIFAWLYPERARKKRVSRAIRAVERTASDRFSLYESPSHSRSRVERLLDIVGDLTVGDRK